MLTLVALYIDWCIALPLGTLAWIAYEMLWPTPEGGK
jgi:hypothetical protein